MPKGWNVVLPKKPEPLKASPDGVQVSSMAFDRIADGLQEVLSDMLGRRNILSTEHTIRAELKIALDQLDVLAEQDGAHPKLTATQARLAAAGIRERLLADHIPGFER